MKWMKTLLMTVALMAGATGIAAVAQEGYHGQYQNDDHDRDRAQNQYRRYPVYNQNGVYGGGDNDRDDRGQYPVYGSPYPVYNGQYPVYGGQYPVYGGQYPVYGGQYPVYGGQYPVYGGSPYYGTGMQQAQQNGYQYGLHDGQIDRQANRSYRATSNETYRNANIGYVSAYGPKGQYQQAFRQAYMQGYQRAYGAGAAGYPNGVPWHR